MWITRCPAPPSLEGSWNRDIDLFIFATLLDIFLSSVPVGAKRGAAETTLPPYDGEATVGRVMVARWLKPNSYSPIRLMVPRRDQLKIEPISRLNHYQK